jgi:hypothetical protein
MEKIFENEKMVELENYFEGVWAGLWRIGKDVILETDELKTPFVVRARMAERVVSGSKIFEEFLVFSKNKSHAIQPLCSMYFLQASICVE